jgi:ribosomal protein S18 acetylase RimI-like enzyme
MLFATATMAARIERAECQIACDFAELARTRRDDVLVAPIGGAAAVFGGPGEPFNKLAGLGFAPIDEQELAGIERAFDARQSPLRVELCSLADLAVAPMLMRRGYELIGFENVLGLELSAAALSEMSAVLTADRARGITIDTISPDERAEWIDVVTTGFAHPDVFDGPPADESYPSETLRKVFEDVARIEGLVQFVARRDGVVAGGGALRVFDGIAQLSGAATLPEHRRRGVQSALLRARLVEAARQGCQLSVVTTQPASKSQENVQRAGFTVLYVRAILVRPVQAVTAG